MGHRIRVCGDSESKYFRPAAVSGTRLWVGEPLKNFAYIGESLGISKQTVGQKAKTKGWQKRMTLADVTTRAYEAADKIVPEKTQGEAQVSSPSRPLLVADPAKTAAAACAIEDRHRLIAAVASGRKGADVARRFGVSPNWARRVAKQIMGETRRSNAR